MKNLLATCTMMTQANKCIRVLERLHTDFLDQAHLKLIIKVDLLGNLAQDHGFKECTAV